MISDTFDPADPRTWPPWMRVDQICTEGDHEGPFPASRFQWRKTAPPPTKFGQRISTWHRNVVAEKCKLPVPDPDAGAAGQGAGGSRPSRGPHNQSHQEREEHPAHRGCRIARPRRPRLDRQGAPIHIILAG